MVPGRLDLRLGLTMVYATASHLAECPDLGPACRGPNPPVPFNHHIALVMSEIPLDVSYGILPWLAAEIENDVTGHG